VDASVLYGTQLMALVLVVFLVFAGLSVLKRNKAGGWTYALVAGFALIGIVRLLVGHLSLIGRLDDMR
jgi:hypothetical protein